MAANITFCSDPLFDGNQRLPAPVWGTSEDVAQGASSSAAPAGTTQVRIKIYGGVEQRIAVGESPSASGATRMDDGTVEYAVCRPGWQVAVGAV